MVVGKFTSRMETSLPEVKRLVGGLETRLPEGLEPPTGREAFAIIRTGGTVDLQGDCT